MDRDCRFLFVWMVGAAALGLSACGAPAAGEKCSNDRPVCSNPRNALVCVSGVWKNAPCEGALGCVEKNGSAQCDDSVALNGTYCLTPLRLSCALGGGQLLQCLNNQWATQSLCTTCSSSGGIPVCSVGNGPGDQNPPVNDGGTEADAGTDAGTTTPPDAGLPTTDGGSDPCNGVPVGGRCIDNTHAEYCFVPTGSSQPTITTLTCGSGMACEGSSGNAKCVPTGVCADGETRCSGTTILETCQGGQWAQTSCPNGCTASAVGATCASGTGFVNWTGSAKYEARGPNGAYTDWSTTVAQYPAKGFLIVSIAGGQTLDAVVTDAQGNFTVKIPSAPGTNDAVYVAAAAVDANGQWQYMVASPQLGSGTYQAGTVPSAPAIWAWGWASNALPTSKVLLVTEAKGSGAARQFEFLDTIWKYGRSRYPTRTPLSLVMWLGYGTEWDCGACFADYPINAFSTQFESQIWFSGGSDNGFWSDPVTAHELGHWWMQSFGTSPDEGGIHIIGVPSFPGLAWSEGWASFLSADVRNNKLYYDKQGGSMFWVDVGTRSYSGGSSFTRPSPGSGLIQLMDEFEVTAMLWELRNSSTTAPASIYNALVAPKMNSSPWARGYTRHTWDYQNGQYTNVVNTGQSRPFVADFFDTMMCSGFPATAMNNACDPSTAYPYPSSAPMCQ